MERKNYPLIVFSIVTVLSIGFTSVPAYAQFTNFQENFVRATWNFDIGIFPTETVPPDFFEFDLNSQFPLTNLQPVRACSGDECAFLIPNFIDDLDSKIIFMDITYSPSNGPPPTNPPLVLCIDSTGTTPGVVIDSGETIEAGANVFFYDILCTPNPDRETISIVFPAANILFVEFETESFSDLAVGGTFIPIDQTALLLAGVQSISMWMIPVVLAGIGIGVFVIKRRN